MHALRIWAALAWRNVWRNRRRSLLTISIVAVATAALALSLGFILSSFEGLKYSVIYGGMGHVQVARSEQFANLENKPLEFGITPEERQRIQPVLAQNPALRKVLGRLAFQGLISNGENTQTFVGDGVQPDAEWQVFGRSMNVVDGEYLSEDDSERFSVMLGKQLAERLHAKVGDNLTLMVAAATGQINAADVTVKGILSTGIADRDRYLLTMPLAGAQSLLRSNKISRLVAVMTSQTSTLPAAAQVEPLLPAHFALRSWRQLNPIYDQLVALYRGQFLVFGTILLGVAFLSILNTVIMNVMERGREIGTLRAMGIDAGRIRTGFLLESFYMCGTGGLAGIAIAKLICVAVVWLKVMMPPPPGYTSGYPLQFIWVNSYVLGCAATLVLAGMIAAWFASRYVARLNVVDAINSH